jgi:hypothetical protein
MKEEEKMNEPCITHEDMRNVDNILIWIMEVSACYETVSDDITIL